MHQKITILLQSTLLFTIITWHKTVQSQVHSVSRRLSNNLWCPPGGDRQIIKSCGVRTCEDNQTCVSYAHCMNDREKDYHTEMYEQNVIQNHTGKIKSRINLWREGLILWHTLVYVWETLVHIEVNILKSGYS